MMRPTPHRLIATLIAGLALLPALARPGLAQAGHPMDALSSGEVARAVELIGEAGHSDDSSRFPTITLREPAKQDVLAWKRGDPVPRAAFVVMQHQARTYEIEIDLSADRIASIGEIEGEPGVIIDEWLAASRLTMADARWREAMARRGFTDFSKVFCSPLTAGRFRGQDYDGRRIMKVPCYVTDEESSHLYGRPIDGLFAVVDVEAGDVLEVVDLGAVEPAPAPRRVEPERDPVKPVLITAPQGNNYTITGTFEVDWQPWKFHLRIDKRVGPVVSLLRYDDAGRERMIAYQMTLSEIFVPYMAPEADWAYRAYIDSGEFGAGGLMSSLLPGSDCPEQAAYFSAAIPNDKGQVFEIRRAACVFERATGDPLWRRGTPAQPTRLTRPGIELVMRTITAIGNYDYAIDWVFQQDGNIEIRLGATGIIAVRGVASGDMSSPGAAADTAHGELVAPGTVAVHHDHFFGFRLDLDVDGTGNTLIRDEITPWPVAGDGPRRSLWTVERSPVATEGALESHGHGTRWRLVNPNLTTALGHNPGIEIVPGAQAESVLAADDESQARAAFSARTMWLTRHRPRELYAAGDYPNLSRGGEGLPAFVGDAQPAENADLVVWLNIGMHHVPRVEDWPVMPVRWKSVTLRPFNFFGENPAFGIPPGFARPEPPALRTTIDSGEQP
jgi:primary-amine oxidase